MNGALKEPSRDLPSQILRAEVEVSGRQPARDSRSETREANHSTCLLTIYINEEVDDD